MALHALESAILCLFPNPYTHTLEPKIIIHKISKVEVNYKGVHSGLFTLISHHKSILSQGEITVSVGCTNALQHSSSRAFECADKN